MSHFSVSVLIGKDELKNNELGNILKEKLAPYQENNMGDCPRKYMEFVNAAEIEKENFKKDNKGFDDYEEYLSEFWGYDYDEEMKAYGYWENPNKKWDWWTVGGRASNLLLVNGEEKDYAKIGDINWSKMQERDSQRSAERYVEAFEEFPEREGLRKLIYDVLPGENKEDYVKRKTNFYTFACVNKEGEWLEKGSIGWWGIVTEEKVDPNEWAENFFNQLIKPLDDEDVIVIIDCHI